MTSDDLKRYWCLAKEAREGMKKFGRAVTAAEWDQERADIHIEVGACIGDIPVSSKDLDELQFRAIRKKFLYWAKPTDLMAMTNELIQDYIRWRWRADELLDRIGAMLEVKDRLAEAEPIKRGPAREGYLLAMFRRIGGRHELVVLDTVTKEEMRKVMAALVYRFDQVARKDAMGHGKKSPTRRGKPPLQRPFDDLIKTPTAAPRPPVKLPACIKPVVLTEPEDENQPF